jgi:hypothetical protein
MNKRDKKVLKKKWSTQTRSHSFLKECMVKYGSEMRIYLINIIKFFVQCCFDFIDKIFGIQVHSFFNTTNERKLFEENAG